MDVSEYAEPREPREDCAGIRRTAATLFRAAMEGQGVAAPLAEERARALSAALPGEGMEIYASIDDVKDALNAPEGEYGQQTFAQRYAADPALAARLADPAARRELLAPGPRTVVRRLMYAALRPDNSGEAQISTDTSGEAQISTDNSGAPGDESACDLARGLERGIYNATIAHFAATSRSDKCQWLNGEFRTSYSARAGAVAAALEGGGAAALKARGSGLAPKARVGLGIEVGRQDEGAINPAPLRALREEFEARRHINVKKRMSHLYRCPECGAREAETREIQMRSSDEPPTIMCTCVCGVVFRGAG